MEHPGRVQLQEGKNKYPQFDENMRTPTICMNSDVPIYHEKCSSDRNIFLERASSSNICYHLRQQSVYNTETVPYPS